MRDRLIVNIGQFRPRSNERLSQFDQRNYLLSLSLTYAISLPLKRAHVNQHFMSDYDESCSKNSALLSLRDPDLAGCPDNLQ